MEVSQQETLEGNEQFIAHVPVPSQKEVTMHKDLYVLEYWI